MKAVAATFGLLVASYSAPADAQSLPDITLQEALNRVCSRQLTRGDTFNSDGRIRADNIVLCIPRNRSATPFLVTRTAAMHQQRFRGSSHAPWLNIQLIDNSGRVVFTRANDYLAEVSNCGGYQLHVVRLPGTYNRARIADLRLSMGGASPDGDCEQSVTNRAIKDLQTRLRRWSQGDFNDEERRQIQFIGSLLSGGGG